MNISGITITNKINYVSNISLSVWGLANALTVALTPLLVRSFKERFLGIQNDIRDTNLTDITKINSAGSDRLQSFLNIDPIGISSKPNSRPNSSNNHKA